MIDINKILTRANIMLVTNKTPEHDAVASRWISLAIAAVRASDHLGPLRRPLLDNLENARMLMRMRLIKRQGLVTLYE